MFRLHIGEQFQQVLQRGLDIMAARAWWASIVMMASVVSGWAALCSLCRQHQRRAITSPVSSEKTTSPGSGCSTSA